MERTNDRGRVRSVGLMVVAALVMAACSPSGGEPTTTTSPSTITSPPPATAPPSTFPATTTTLVVPAEVTLERGEYLPGLSATLYLPAEISSASLVVMVPGGGWRSADPTGYARLAVHLAESGLVVLTTRISAADDGAVYPTPVEDIHCAVGYAIARAEEAGISSDTVILLGHSSGAHLSALAALTAAEELPECPDPTRSVDALIGLAGVYDVTRLPALAFLLFGVAPDDDPELWEDGNPLLRAAMRPELPVLLLHGDADQVVPVSFTSDFALTLEEGGHNTAVTIIPGADHNEIYSPEVSGDLIVEWIEELAEAD